MSIAWGSLLLLLVLLPGVLFFVGLYIPEKFTRDSTERSALGQLAGVLLVSILVHGPLYAFGPLVCGGRVPCVDLSVFLTTLTLDKPDPSAIATVSSNVSTYRNWILAYVLLASAMGIAYGWAVGHLALRGPFRFLIQHRWVYNLSLGDQLTTAWVLTNVKDGNRVLMYRGFPRAFHLKRDGTFSYIVLTHVRRGYLILDDDRPKATPLNAWMPIGASLRSAEKAQLKVGTFHHEHVNSYFAIEGEDIANIVFDRYQVSFYMGSTKAQFDEAVRRIVTEFTKPMGPQLPLDFMAPPKPPGDSPPGSPRRRRKR